MKKLRVLAVLLGFLFIVIMSACAPDNASPTTPEATLSTPEESVEPTDTPDETQTEKTEPEPSVVAPENQIIRLSTTTSVNDSGLLPYLQPFFEKDTGYRLEITSAGTGAAIEKGRTGDADALLVHAKASEEAFIEEGYSAERFPFMYNYFVILGPSDDPAGVMNVDTASEALKAIAESESAFVSRGDNSGTHKAELKIWQAAEIEPDPQVDKWYISAGDGMGACINMAAEQQAYVLSDKATYLAHEMRGELVILLEKSDEMMNTYSMLAISTDKWPDTNIDGANAFIEWMTSDKAKDLINAYGLEEYGEQLFFTID